jgi:hypothetical protein
MAAFFFFQIFTKSRHGSFGGKTNTNFYSNPLCGQSFSAQGMSIVWFIPFNLIHVYVEEVRLWLASDTPLVLTRYTSIYIESRVLFFSTTVKLFECHLSPIGGTFFVKLHVSHLSISTILWTNKNLNFTTKSRHLATNDVQKVGQLYIKTVDSSGQYSRSPWPTEFRL